MQTTPWTKSESTKKKKIPHSQQNQILKRQIRVHARQPQTMPRLKLTQVLVFDS